jgi:hypothetical protein
MGSYNIPNTTNIFNEEWRRWGVRLGWIVFMIAMDCVNFDWVCELGCVELCYVVELCDAFELWYDEAMILNARVIRCV